MHRISPCLLLKVCARRHGREGAFTSPSSRFRTGRVALSGLQCCHLLRWRPIATQSERQVGSDDGDNQKRTRKTRGSRVSWSSRRVAKTERRNTSAMPNIARVDAALNESLAQHVGQVAMQTAEISKDGKTYGPFKGIGIG
jgi:hypothetical protein